MTTVLADFKLGLMVSDSCMSDGDKVSSMRKVWRIRGALVGLAGSVEEFNLFLSWYRGGKKDKLVGFNGAALVLTHKRLDLYCASALPVPMKRDAIGTGSMTALAAHEALGFKDPRRAVAITCKYDAQSRGPVRVYRLQPKD